MQVVRARAFRHWLIRGQAFEAKIIIMAPSMTAARMSPGEARVQFRMDGIKIRQSAIAGWPNRYSGMIIRGYSAAPRVDAGHR